MVQENFLPFCEVKHYPLYSTAKKSYNSIMHKSYPQQNELYRMLGHPRQRKKDRLT